MQFLLSFIFAFSFLEVFCRSCCSTLINVVMKYSFSTAVVKSWRALHANSLKIALHHRYFSENFTKVQNSDIEKWILMAASEDEFIFETFLHGCFSKAAVNMYSRNLYFRNSYTYFTFLIWRHVKEEWILWSFWIKGFGKKCRHTELALNFDQKQYFS